MNKIRLVNNKIIPFAGDSILIEDNCITFLSNGSYFIEYIDTNNVNLEFNINDGIYIDLFEYSEKNIIDINNKYNINKNSSLILNKFYSNIMTKEILDINLNEKKASVKYNFSSISNNEDKYVINIHHLNNNTTSDIFNKTIAKEKSSNSFDINSYVENGIKDCFLNQQTKIVTLGCSNNRINPNMFTHDNSTIATHSSIIGNVNKDDLFYLMSRGINYNDSINLIIKGTILSNINPDMETKERILTILNEMGGE